MGLKILKNTLMDIWPMLTIFLVVIATLRITYLRINNEKFIFHKEFLSLIFVLYAMLLFGLLTNTELNSSSGINLVPFIEIMRYKIGSDSFMLNVIGNILIFIPFGYLVSNYIKASKVSHIAIVSVIISFAVELVQHYIGRSFDIDDIILNVIGSIIGFFLYISLNAIKKHLPKFFRSDLFYNIICLILLAIFIVYFGSNCLGWF